MLTSVTTDRLISSITARAVLYCWRRWTDQASLIDRHEVNAGIHQRGDERENARQSVELRHQQGRRACPCERVERVSCSLATCGIQRPAASSIPRGLTSAFK
jgi:hypothetical protein